MRKTMLPVLLSACALAAPAWSAGTPIADCVGVTDAKSKSRLLFEGKTLMSVLLMLEAKGEAGFHPAYAQPASKCIYENFEAAGLPVQAIYAPFDKGAAPTLHWAFIVSGPETRELLVLYDGTASLLAKKDVFYLVEDRDGSISWYAMFRDQPTYAALNPIVISILDGSAKPLATVHWPPGEKEPVIDAYDTSRIK